MEDKIEKKNDKNELFNDEEFSEQLTYVAPPYLPPLKEKDKKLLTLVLDLDETLVHYEEVYYLFVFEFYPIFSLFFDMICILMPKFCFQLILNL